MHKNQLNASTTRVQEGVEFGQQVRAQLESRMLVHAAAQLDANNNGVQGESPVVVQFKYAGKLALPASFSLRRSFDFVPTNAAAAASSVAGPIPMEIDK